jgi:hypothetical protein
MQWLLIIMQLVTGLSTTETIMEPVRHDAVFLVWMIVDAVHTIRPDNDLLVGTGSVLIDRAGYFEQANGIKSTVELKERALDLIRFWCKGKLS